MTNLRGARNFENFKVPAELFDSLHQPSPLPAKAGRFRQDYCLLALAPIPLPSALAQSVERDREMKGLYPKSARRSPRNEAPSTPNPDSFYGSSGSSFYDSALISPEGRGSNVVGVTEKQRKTKLEKIRELLEENRKLKDTAWQLQQELKQKELQIRQLDGRHQSQHISGEGTKEGEPEGKHMEALRALTAVTKTQQESLAAHHERYEQLSREFEEREMESKQLRRDLQKKKKEVAMLEKEIDSNLLEITGLRKELAQAIQASERSETEIRGDRRKILELSREVALLKAGRKGAPNEVKIIADQINVFDDEMKEKDAIIEAQQLELENQRAEIQRLQVELERTQEQVEEYEQERDATVADMERYYEVLKFELEEKSRLLEEAEREKAEIDTETTAALRALEERCNQLNTEVLDAHDEISVLRRESDTTIFPSVVKSETAQHEFEEERQRLHSNLEAMSTELNSLKQRHEEMEKKHSEAYKALEQENNELKLQHSDLKYALREANVHNRTISEENHVIRIENDSLLEVSRDLKLKVREMQASEERIVPPTVTKTESDQVQQSKALGPTLVDASSPTPFNSINLEPVLESSESIGSNSDGDKGTDNGSSCFSDEAVVDQEGSPTSSDQEPLGQQALLLAATQSQPSPANSDDDVTPSGQQALLLAAAAGLQKQKAQPESKSLNSSWRSMIKRGQSNSPLPPAAGSNMSTSSSADIQIKQLEKINQEQRETIKKLQSELVRLNAFYRDAAYLSKRKMESLVNENAAYEIKIIVLEKMLEKLGASADTHSFSGSVDPGATAADADSQAARSETSSHEEASPKRDSSSPPKNLDQINELEEKVIKLEKEKNDAEEKMKAIVTDLENFQRTSKRAALDSMLEIERLKRENAEKERRLSMFQNEMAEVDNGDSEREAVGEYDL